MVDTIQLKRCVTRTGVFRVIVGKLYHREESCPIILLLIHKSPKVSFDVTVLLLRLTVCLKVKRGGKFFFDAEEVAEREPELGRQNRSLVTNNKVKKAVILYHYTYDYFR